MLPRIPDPTGVMMVMGQIQSPLETQCCMPASFSRSMVLKA